MTVRVIDAVDVALITAVCYWLYGLLRRTALLRLLIGVLLLYALWRTADILDMTLTRTLLDDLLGVAGVALVVVFAPELRRYLLSITQLGGTWRLRRRLTEPLAQERVYQEIIDAMDTLAAAHTGAIVVLEGNNNLDHIEQTGDTLNAEVTSRLLMSIFSRNSPLHDGAVLIRDNTIVAARTVLPISDDPDIPAELGMRHRAALGITEVSDAAAIVVSEESGKISVAMGGRIKRNLSGEELLTFLHGFSEAGQKLV